MKKIPKPFSKLLLALIFGINSYCPIFAQTIITYQATKDFTKLTLPNYSNYSNDNGHNAVFIASSPALNPGTWAAAQVIFKGATGVYDLNLTSLDEIDGESSYKVSVNGIQIGPTFQNQNLNSDTSKDYNAETFTIKNQTIKLGDSIQVESNRVSNGKFFLSAGNPDYGRGRWTKLEFLPVPAAEPVIITKQPVDTAVIIGAKAEFLVRASGPGTLTYKWRKNLDTAIIGTDSILSFIPVLADSGNQYFCTIANSETMVRSRNALLGVSHDSCHKIFTVENDTISISEGRPVSLKGQAVCAQSFFWTTDSGPAPRILDPEVLNLTFTAPRISSPTVISYVFNAEFANQVQSKRVLVRVLDSIPDPLISLPTTYTWDGKNNLALIPTLINKKNLDDANMHPILNFNWTTPEELSDAVSSGDSLILSQPKQSGTFKISLCVDNGGKGDCQSTLVTITIPVKLEARNGKSLNQSIIQSNNALFWSEAAMVRIWDLTGHLRWKHHGKKGDLAKLPYGIAYSIKHHQAKMEISP